MIIRDLYIGDSLYYWFLTGPMSTVIELEAMLAQEPDQELFKKAVRTALCVYTNFRTHPVIMNGRVKAMIPDMNEVGEVPVFTANNQIRQLGTGDTCGYLFYFSLEGRKLKLHLYHGVSDGHGTFDFFRTVMRCYLEELGVVPRQKHLADSVDTAPVNEQAMKACEGMEPLGRFDAQPEDIFHMPVEYYPEESTVQRMFEINLPIAELLAFSRSNESSVVPTLQAMIGKALRSHYDVGDKIISAYTPIDIRPVFGLKGSGNGSFVFDMPYRAAMDHYDLPMRAMLLRSIMEVQSLPENMNVRMRNNQDAVVQVASQPYPIEVIAGAVRSKVPSGDQTLNTYGLTYPGKVSFPEEETAFIESFMSNVNIHSYPMMISACEYKGVLRMIINQDFESDAPVRAIFREIEKNIPGTVFLDRGIQEYDRMDLELLEKLN